MRKQHNKKTIASSTGEQKKPAPLWLRYTGGALCALALLVAYGVMLGCESDYLFRVQEMNLFLYTPLFFKQQLVVAGGLLTWLGTYFTQFFYHPWLGALMLCAWLALLMWLISRTFRVERLWAPLLLIPVALILLTDFDLGYWLFYLKLRGHFFIAVMGTAMAVGLTWLYRVIPARYTFMVVAAIVAYPVGGFYGLLAVLLMAVITWRLPELTLTHRILSTVLASVLIAVVPLIYYRQVYYQASSDMVWWQILPIYPSTEGVSPYYYPYVLLCVFLMVMAALYRVDLSLPKLQRPWMRVGLQLVVAALVTVGCWNWWYKDKTFHEELQMNACIDVGDWEGALKIARQHEGEPTRMIVTFKNLALFKLGRAGDEMYTYPDGAKAPNCPFELRMAQIGGKQLYLNYGLPNYCYRWCLEDGVENGWRVEYFKFLVRCALLNGEWKVAKKYIDLLKQTKYYREWAERYEPLATPSIANELPKHPEFAPILRLMKGIDLLGSDQSIIELFLLNIQAYRQTNDVVCAELVLLSALQLKDIPAFWRAFNQYAILKKDGRIPRHFQEAAFLYGNLERNVDISHMPFDPSIPASYQAFMQAAQQCQGMSDEQMKVALRSRFGDTFYYDYFLMRNMKTY